MSSFILTIIIWCITVTIFSLYLLYKIRKLEKGEPMDDELRLREFNEELERNHFRQQSPIPNQQPANPQIQKEQANINQQLNNFTGPPPAQLQMTSARCDQCGTFHPPLKPGEKCPVAPIKSTGGNEIDLNPFFAQLKNICMSQIQQKSIKDHDKLFKHIIVEITKSLENYSE